MTSKTGTLAAALSAVFALSGTALSADEQNVETCYGVARVGKNDPAAAAHACARQSAHETTRPGRT